MSKLLKFTPSLFAAAAAFVIGHSASAQTIVEPAPATSVVEAPVLAAPAAAPTAPVADIVVGVPEVTLQLHPVTHFGAAKQVFVHGASNMVIYGRHTQSPEALGPVNKSDMFSLSLEAKAGSFVTDRFAAGMVGSVNFNNTMLSQGIALHVGPFVAVHVPMHHHMSFFPSLAGTYGYANNVNKSASSAFAHDIELELQLTVLFHVTEHYSVSFSPFANQVLYSRVGAGASREIPRVQGPWVTVYGAKLGLLFWR